MNIINQNYHRNGVSGEGFWVTMFEWPENGLVVDETELFTAITFEVVDENGNTDWEESRARTAILRLRNPLNKWRGADYADPIIEALKARELNP